MTGERSTEYLLGLLHELRRLPKESEWVEFKVNNTKPDDIGERFSALSNSAALLGKSSAYLVWGIEDGTHRGVGTTFAPGSAKVGNEELENWLLRLMTPQVDFRFHELAVDGRSVVIAEIDPAFRQPVQFKGQEYIRVGSYTKPLKDYPEKA